jgi:hypothetical protein
MISMMIYGMQDLMFECNQLPFTRVPTITWLYVEKPMRGQRYPHHK